MRSIRRESVFCVDNPHEAVILSSSIQSRTSRDYLLHANSLPSTEQQLNQTGDKSSHFSPFLTV